MQSAHITAPKAGPRTKSPAAKADPTDPLRQIDSTADPGRGTANDLLAVGLVLVVLLAPLPVGSNRGAIWALWAVLLGAGAATYLLAIAFAGAQRSFRAAPVRRWFWVLGATLLFAVAQTLPIASVVPAWAQALPDAVAQRPASLSLAPSASLLAVMRSATMLLFLFLMIEASARPGRAQMIGWALFSGVAVYAVWSFALLLVFGDRYFWGEKTSALGSATGTFVSHNSFALFLAIGAVLGLSLILERARVPRMRHPGGRRRISRASLMTLLLWSMLGVVVAALLATRSQIGVAAGLAGLGLVWAVTPRGDAKGASGRHRWIGAGLSATAGLAVLALVIFGIPTQAAAPQGSPEVVAHGDFTAQAWRMVLARPFAGYGLDAFPAAFELFHRAPVSPEFLWEKAPSTYLGLWVELGVVFGTLPLLAAAGFLSRLIHVLQARRHDLALVVSAVAALLVVGVHSIADFGIEMQANQFLLAAVLGLGLARRIVPARPGAKQ